MKSVWIPEAPEHPGLYANRCGTDIRPKGKIQDSKPQPSTFVAADALQFDTYKDCYEWCIANPIPKFVPVEHGFEDAGPKCRNPKNGVCCCDPA